MQSKEEERPRGRSFYRLLGSAEQSFIDVAPDDEMRTKLRA
jgi:hypothetical protein